jgi:hypothetical protein
MQWNNKCSLVKYALTYRWGDPKIPGIVRKIYLNYLYKFETLVPSEVLPLRLDSAIPAPLPMLETLSKIFKGNAVKGRQRSDMVSCERTWFMWSDFILRFSEVKWSEVSYGEVRGAKSTMYIRVNLYWGSLIVLWLLHLLCICTVVVLTGFVMCVWLYVGVFRQFCGCFGNMCTCIYCVLYCSVYVYLFLFVLSVLL